LIIQLLMGINSGKKKCSVCRIAILNGQRRNEYL
jgi:hypothetical protein